MNETDPFGALRRLLLEIAPPDGVVVRDIAGRSYRLPAGIPLRRQARLILAVEGLLGGETQALLAQVRDGALPPARILALLGGDAVLDAVDRIVADALPELLEAARYNASQPDARASDLFAGEEVLAAVLPFVALAIRRGSQALAPAAQ